MVTAGTLTLVNVPNSIRFFFCSSLLYSIAAASASAASNSTSEASVRSSRKERQRPCTEQPSFATVTRSTSKKNHNRVHIEDPLKDGKRYYVACLHCMCEWDAKSIDAVHWSLPVYSMTPPAPFMTR